MHTCSFGKLSPNIQQSRYAYLLFWKTLAKHPTEHIQQSRLRYAYRYLLFWTWLFHVNRAGMHTALLDVHVKGRKVVHVNRAGMHTCSFGCLARVFFQRAQGCSRVYDLCSKLKGKPSRELSFFKGTLNPPPPSISFTPPSAPRDVQRRRPCIQP